MKIRHFLLLIISLLSLESRLNAQDNYLPDLTFEKVVNKSIENESISLKIEVKNIGKKVSQPTNLTIYATYNSVSKADIKRLKLKLAETDFFYEMYQIQYDIPTLAINETIIFNLNLEHKLTTDCAFLIQIDAANELIELNERNNQTAFPQIAINDFGIYPDLIIKKIYSPEYNDETRGTILRIDIENIGLAKADSVTLEVWDIVADFSNIPERDLRAVLGENWWALTEILDETSTYDLQENLGTIDAGMTTTITIKLDSWIYNPNCKIGTAVKTTSFEDNTANNTKSFIEGG